MKVVFWGTYDTGKPRMRILLAGLAASGVEIIQIHADVWRGVEDKSGLGAWRRIQRLFRWLTAYPWLLVRYLRAPPHEAVVIAYLGQIDVLVLWPLARIRRVPIVWDMFVPLHETLVLDRRLAPRRGLVASAAYAIEWLGCRAADRVILDTAAHARSIEAAFGLAPGSVGSVPVGAEPAHFPRLPPPRRDQTPAAILFYGQLIPLHGIETILRAAALPAARAYRWTLIGSGQDEPLLRAFLEADPIAHLTWESWVPYERLIDRIAAADVCLGIFGASEKAAAVVPNKAYQVLAAGRSLVTRDSPAMRELVPAATPGVRLVPPADPDALLAAIASLVEEGCPQPPASLAATFAPPAIGQRLRTEIERAVLRRRRRA